MKYIGIINIIIGFIFIANDDISNGLIWVCIGIMCFVAIIYSKIKSDKLQSEINNLRLKLQDKSKDADRLNSELSFQILNVESLRKKVDEIQTKLENKPIEEYEKAKQRVLNNYRKRELEKQALLDLIEEGVIFDENEPDEKYLKSLQRKYKMKI